MYFCDLNMHTEILNSFSSQPDENKVFWVWLKYAHTSSIVRVWKFYASWSTSFIILNSQNSHLGINRKTHKYYEVDKGDCKFYLWTAISKTQLSVILRFHLSGLISLCDGATAKSYSKDYSVLLYLPCPYICTGSNRAFLSVTYGLCTVGNTQKHMSVFGWQH